MKKMPKNAEIYVCENCNFKCSKKSNFDKHLLTRKHKILTNPNEKMPKNAAAFQCECGKVYKHNSTVSSHKKKCTFIIETTKSEIVPIQSENNDYKHLLMQAMNEMKEQRQEFIDEMKKKDQMLAHKDELMGQMIDKVGNTTNNTSNNLNININDNFLPELKISIDYKKMLENQKEKEVKKFVKNKIESAYWFIDALKKRHQTLYLIIDAIIKRQKSFFRDGKKLKPMILKDIANDINMDISTISRMTNGKYVQLSFGIYELKYFFSEGIKTDSGELVSNKTVKEILKTIIENEDKKNHYGDEKLSAILNQKGFKIARRTVTKYRESLKIPIGRLRKEL